MSIEAFKWAKTFDIDRRPLHRTSPTANRPVMPSASNQKFVLLMIADYFNEKDLCAWPALSTLARDTGMSRTTVERCIRALEDQGLIEVEAVFKARTNERTASRYRLPLYNEASTSNTHLEHNIHQLMNEAVSA